MTLDHWKTAGEHGGTRGLHVATLTHDGRIWDAYLELDDDPHRPDTCRAHVRFDPSDPAAEQGSVSTGVIIIEQTYEDAVAKVRSFDPRQMEGLLRSALPDTEAEAS